MGFAKQNKMICSAQLTKKKEWFFFATRLVSFDAQEGLFSDGREGLFLGVWTHQKSKYFLSRCRIRIWFGDPNNSKNVKLNYFLAFYILKKCIRKAKWKRDHLMCHTSTSWRACNDDFNRHNYFDLENVTFTNTSQKKKTRWSQRWLE